jgi:hypothetical protein
MLSFEPDTSISERKVQFEQAWRRKVKEAWRQVTGRKIVDEEELFVLDYLSCAADDPGD